MKRPQSIWGGIDLAAIANEVAKAKMESAIAEATPQPIPEDVRSQAMVTSSEALPDAEDVPDVPLPQPPTVEEAPMQETSNAQTGGRRTRNKKRWRKDVPLPRGERWKRRLPWLLRQSRAYCRSTVPG
ncbi:hypothetical protein [Mesorhizobium sp. 113-3-3]|uniref:hypothetical protein n=1 Tax=Mesorhizobium sp. 113-3-3 TaxID=2744516 RepID=UPI0018EB1D90|nr:hypothetical protein [Mesorhizobium sp. 113-3-3]BCG83345.1 hypothetical protein MesoLj113b_68870 [Mesorhizobium sp. 113-3-3]